MADGMKLTAPMQGQRGDWAVCPKHYAMWEEYKRRFPSRLTPTN